MRTKSVAPKRFSSLLLSFIARVCIVTYQKRKQSIKSIQNQRKFFRIYLDFFGFFVKKRSTESEEKERVQRKAIFWIMGN